MEGQKDFDGDSHCHEIECQVCIETGETSAASLILFHFVELLQRKETMSICTRLYFMEIDPKGTFV